MNAGKAKGAKSLSKAVTYLGRASQREITDEDAIEEWLNLKAFACPRKASYSYLSARPKGGKHTAIFLPALKENSIRAELRLL